VAADRVTANEAQLAGVPVLSEENAEQLGRVDGFILDAAAGHAYFVVVDSGGWFKSRRVLVPIGHARFEEGSLHVDIAKTTLSRYPSFDPDRFDQWDVEDLRAFERDTAAACCPHESIADDVQSYEALTHYRQPAWWVGRPISEREASIVRETMPSGPTSRS
jgi:hypothetical protein